MTDPTKSQKNRHIPRWPLIVILPLMIIALLIAILAVLPIEADPVLAETAWGVGSAGVGQTSSGLIRNFPQVQAPDPALANLGYRLFFDPLLSGDNTFSCAHCHHPDMGFSDGRQVSIGENGDALDRNSMTLWNVAYNAPLFWDGRAATLEEQLIVPLTAENEMDQDLDALVEELAAIDAYVAMFSAVFEDGITVDNIAAALADFERTLISDGSAFDRYAAGDFDALSARQRRGLDIFRSEVTRCIDCHSPTLFGDQRFVVLGVPDNGSNDRGAGAIYQGALDFTFRVPTLRNVVLNAPYMHNGHFASLQEVVDFYSNGAGLGAGFAPLGMDRFVAQGFTLTPQEQDDLIALLHALTDETIPERLWGNLDFIDDEGHVVIPTAVPSSLDDQLITPQHNPARDEAVRFAADPREGSDCAPSEDGVIIVAEGQTIQRAVDCAAEGDTILVPPGIYRERVVIDTNGITLRGMVDDAPATCPVSTGGAEPAFPTGSDRPRWPVLEGDINGDGISDLADGVYASGNAFTMEHFIVQNTTSSGVVVRGAQDVTLRHIFTDNTTTYGLSTARSDDVLIECAVATRVNNAGIYVGQSQGIIVRDNLAYDSAIGIAIENSVDAEVHHNEVWNNTGGIGVFLLPNLPSRVSQNIAVHDNTIHHNNRVKDNVNGGFVALVPVGTGLLVLASDDVAIDNNRIEHNDSFGVGVLSLYATLSDEAIGSANPLSERAHVRDNLFAGNGGSPDSFITDLGMAGADILWDARGSGNLFDQPGASASPSILPGSRMPEFARRALFQVWRFVANDKP